MVTSTTTYSSRLLKSEYIAEGTMAFHLERPADFFFRAGQYIEVTLVNPPETDAEGNTRALSLVSAPSEQELVVATRIRDTAFKRVLQTLSREIKVEIEGPMGSFTLHRNALKPAVFIAGGIGITPFMSMLRDVAARNMLHEIFLFYSNGWPEYAPYLRELQELQNNHAKFHLIPTMTEMERSRELWHGQTGPITPALLSRHLNLLQDAIYYISGSTGMVANMQDMLVRMAVDEDDIRTEQFGGY